MKKILVKGVNWSGGMIDTFIIVNDGALNDQSIVVAPSLHLLEKAKAGAKKKTQQSAASDLCSYFEDLHAKEIDWRYVTDTEISSYLGKTLQQERNLSEVSIERNIASIKDFYKTVAEIGILDTEIFLSYKYSSEPSRKLQEGSGAKPKFQLFRQYIHKQILTDLLASVKGKSPFVRERDELVLNIGFHCGLRSSEVTSTFNLDTRVIRKALDQAAERKELGITLPIIGKGNKLRHVDFNPRITMAIKNFLEGRRLALPDGHLICDRFGGCLSESHASRVFKSAKDCGLSRIKKTVVENKKNTSDMTFEYMISFESAKKLVFHSLRHTFATNLVKHCYKLGIDPWVYVRDQMGHEKRETTESYIVFEANIHARDAIRTELSIEDENY